MNQGGTGQPDFPETRGDIRHQPCYISSVAHYRGLLQRQNRLRSRQPLQMSSAPINGSQGSSIETVQGLSLLDMHGRVLNVTISLFIVTFKILSVTVIFEVTRSS